MEKHPEPQANTPHVCCGGKHKAKAADHGHDDGHGHCGHHGEAGLHAHGSKEGKCCQDKE